MPASGSVQVEVDSDAIKAADKMLNDRIDAEVHARISKENKTKMDAAQTQAALDAANQKASAAALAAADARKEVDGLKAGIDNLTAGMKAIVDGLKAQADASKTAQDADLTGKARQILTLRNRGDASKVTDAEVARLKALGSDALDDQMQLLTTPGLVSASYTAPAQAATDGIRRNGDGSYTVADWTKFPRVKADRDSMGTPALLSGGL